MFGFEVFVVAMFVEEVFMDLMGFTKLQMYDILLRKKYMNEKLKNMLVHEKIGLKT